MAPLAAQWSYDLAGIELSKVERIQAQLREQGHEVSDAAGLLAKARQFLATAKADWDAKDYHAAYKDSQRAVRPLRILMRAEWEAAAKSLGPDAPPTASPFAVSYFTLPKHWKFRAMLEQCSPGGNKLPDGDFESRRRPAARLADPAGDAGRSRGRRPDQPDANRTTAGGA